MIRGIQALSLLDLKTAGKLVKNQEQIYQLHETLNVMRLNEQNALNRRLVRKTQDGTLGRPDVAVPADQQGSADMTPTDEEEADKVSFGDTTTTYNLEDKSGTKSSLIPWILTAALGGAGLGALAAMLPSLLNPTQPTPVVVSPSNDTDTLYDLQFKEEN